MMIFYYFAPFGIFWWFIKLIWWGFILWIAIALIKRPRSDSGRSTLNTEPPPREKSPLEILQDRYVRGEITKREYNQKKLDLM